MTSVSYYLRYVKYLNYRYSLMYTYTCSLSNSFMLKSCATNKTKLVPDYALTITYSELGSNSIRPRLTQVLSKQRVLNLFGRLEGSLCDGK